MRGIVYLVSGQIDPDNTSILIRNCQVNDLLGYLQRFIPTNLENKADNDVVVLLRANRRVTYPLGHIAEGKALGSTQCNRIRT